MSAEQQAALERKAMTTAERVKAYRQRRRADGDVLLSAYVPAETVTRMRRDAKKYDCHPDAFVCHAIEYLCNALASGKAKLIVTETA